MISLPATPDRHVVLIGLGNIGAPLVEMLARNELVDRLTLIDHDVYEPANLAGQAIQPNDIGKPKAVVQAERARTIRSSLAVEGICTAVEVVPLGRLRGSVVLTGLDSKLSRQHVNERIWRLGVPWVDGGVDAAGWLARITIYVPGPDQPCLECAWDDGDYQTLAVRRPCQAGTGVAPSGAPAFLGALAAALLMAEATKLLSRDWGSVKPGTQITIAAGAHRLVEMRFRHNPHCRFDHVICGEIRPLPWVPDTSSLGAFFADLRKALALTKPVSVQVEVQRFDRQLRCECGEEKSVLSVQGRMPIAERLCPRCGGNMSPVGFSQIASLSEEALLPAHRGRLLSAAGLRTGDIITVKSGAATKAFELVEDRKAEAA